MNIQMNNSFDEKSFLLEFFSSMAARKGAMAEYTTTPNIYCDFPKEILQANLDYIADLLGIRFIKIDASEISKTGIKYTDYNSSEQIKNEYICSDLYYDFIESGESHFNNNYNESLPSIGSKIPNEYKPLLKNIDNYKTLLLIDKFFNSGGNAKKELLYKILERKGPNANTWLYSIFPVYSMTKGENTDNDFNRYEFSLYSYNNYCK